jgi:hypothetical protein
MSTHQDGVPEAARAAAAAGALPGAEAGAAPLPAGNHGTGLTGAPGTIIF